VINKVRHVLSRYNYYRPKWIKIYGQEYHQSDYVVVSVQLNDLPQFAKIKNIFVIAETPVLVVELFETCGINNHLLCYLIENSYQTCAVCVSNLLDYYPLTAHSYIGDKRLYISLRSYVFK